MISIRTHNKIYIRSGPGRGGVVVRSHVSGAELGCCGVEARQFHLTGRISDVIPV